jgi:[acyl-carrier-protein] S-malonyltransferase
MKIAVIYGGQGSQFVGMGKMLYETNAVFRTFIDQANSEVDFDLVNIMFNEETIHQTKYAQVAIFSMNVGLTQLLKEKGIKIEASAGLSLGEYNALLNSGVFNFQEGLKIITHRGKVMQDSSLNQATKMVALLGNLEAVTKCIEPYEDVFIANYNALTQYVVGGSEASIMKVMDSSKDYGIKRAVLLETSGAFHTPYMMDAQTAFESFLAPLSLNEPIERIYLNVTGLAYQNNIRQSMIDQITSPVKFYDMIMNMEQDGFDCFIEIGPKPILKSMLKKLVTTKHVYHIDDLESLNQTVAAIKEADHEVS